MYPVYRAGNAPCSWATTACCYEEIIIQFAERATAVMETEDVEGTRDLVHRLGIVKGDRQGQENCGQILAVCGRNVSVNYSSSST